MPKALTPKQVLTTANDAFVAVDCPEWGGTVYIRMLSADERDRYEVQQAELADGAGTRALLVAMAWCDEAGTPIKVSPAEVQALGRQGSAPVDRCFRAAVTLNRMRKSDQEEAQKN